jgi:hypothetical protein
MNKIYTFLAALLLTTSTFAQAPEKMSYQAVIRNSSDALVANQAVGMRISILQTTATGTAVYAETQTPTTNINGLVSLEIGSGTPVTGTFAGINWAAGPYFIKTETDLTGGTTYTITGTSQLMSVPYALHAKTAESVISTGSVKHDIYFIGGSAGWQLISGFNKKSDELPIVPSAPGKLHSLTLLLPVSGSIPDGGIIYIVKQPKPNSLLSTSITTSHPSVMAWISFRSMPVNSTWGFGFTTSGPILVSITEGETAIVNTGATYTNQMKITWNLGPASNEFLRDDWIGVLTSTSGQPAPYNINFGMNGSSFILTTEE